MTDYENPLSGTKPETKAESEPDLSNLTAEQLKLLNSAFIPGDVVGIPNRSDDINKKTTLTLNGLPFPRNVLAYFIAKRINEVREAIIKAEDSGSGTKYFKDTLDDFETMHRAFSKSDSESEFS